MLGYFKSITGIAYRVCAIWSLKIGSIIQREHPQILLPLSFIPIRRVIVSTYVISTWCVPCGCMSSSAVNRNSLAIVAVLILVE